MLGRMKLFFNWVIYSFAERSNRYSHKAVGQQDKNGKTIILYTILGKRDVYKIDIESLMEDKSLLEHFHPCETAKFGAIAIGDALFSYPKNEREAKYKNIKEQMFEHDGSSFY